MKTVSLAFLNCSCGIVFMLENIYEENPYEDYIYEYFFIPIAVKREQTKNCRLKKMVLLLPLCSNRVLKPHRLLEFG